MLIEEGGACHDLADNKGRSPLTIARLARAGGAGASGLAAASNRTIEYLEWAASCSGVNIDVTQAIERFGAIMTETQRAHLEAKASQALRDLTGEVPGRPSPRNFAFNPVLVS